MWLKHQRDVWRERQVEVARQEVMKLPSPTLGSPCCPEDSHRDLQAVESRQEVLAGQLAARRRKVAS